MQENVQLSHSQRSESAELSRLRNDVIRQARELAVIRWELASLLQRNPVLGRVTQAKYFFLPRFLKFVHKAGHLKRAARNLLGSLWRAGSGRSGLGRKPSIKYRSNVCGPILLADDSAAALAIARIVRSRDLIAVSPGAGFINSLPIAQPGEPPLRSPARGSLVQWLVEDQSRLRRVGTIVVEAGDDVSQALLRGRLHSDQGLVLTHSTGVTSSLVAELGAPIIQEGGASYYARAPLVWLDPLDRDLRPNAAIVNQREWPKISVVMVSFNQAKFLEEGIRSVLEQGYPNLEFLVIDGNSTDGSGEILERYRERLSFLLSETDQGQSDGLNKGFARVTGDILTWVNSDDLLEPGALFRVAQAFMDYGVDMVAGGCRQIGMTRSQVILNHHNRLPFGVPVALPLGLLLEMERFWLAGSFFYQPEVFFSRDIWHRSGGRLRTDLKYILDYDLWVRMAAAGATIVHIPDFLACSRTHDQQKTTVGMPYMPEVQRLLQEYASRLASPPP
jgi:Glycosyl transferase family 2